VRFDGSGKNAMDFAWDFALDLGKNAMDFEMDLARDLGMTAMDHGKTAWSLEMIGVPHTRDKWMVTWKKRQYVLHKTPILHKHLKNL